MIVCVEQFFPGRTLPFIASANTGLKIQHLPVWNAAVNVGAIHLKCPFLSVN
jgi:hypothetical protein